MQNFKKLLILENDTQSQGLPEMLEDCINNQKLPYNVWWWFNQSIIQKPEESFKTFSEIDSETLLVSYPSFAGYGNTFESKIYLFDKLKEQNIKLNIAILYYPSFYWFLIKWLHNISPSITGDKEKQKVIKVFKEVIEYHNISFFTYDKPLLESINRITWQTLEPNYFYRDQKLKIKSTGEIINFFSICVNENKPENTKITYLEELENDKYTFNDSLRIDDVEKL